jgi:hypothetical protein
VSPLTPAVPTTLDFDSDIAAAVNRARDAGCGPATIEAFENYLVADAEFTAQMRAADAAYYAACPWARARKAA